MENHLFLKILRQSIRQLTGWQKVAIGAMLVLILCTWLSVCYILATYLGP